MHVAVIGAGVAGLVAATELLERGADVTIVERGPAIGAGACSWLAGGMLAPWCERESAEPAVVDLGRRALEWWPSHFAGTRREGTLVVAPARDTADLTRFARRTETGVALDSAAIAALEPDLAGRFHHALFFAAEAHLDPRVALTALAERLEAGGATLRFGVDGTRDIGPCDATLDCRGLAARDTRTDLRGVRGEMVVVRAPAVTLSRPIRLLHPRIPVYVVPRDGGRFMIGATMVESDHSGPMTVRSAIELLNAAYALHPGFAEAEILELGADVRPAHPDNLPQVTRQGRVVSINGLYRHGFLLSPACAGQAADLLLGTARAAA